MQYSYAVPLGGTDFDAEHSISIRYFIINAPRSKFKKKWMRAGRFFADFLSVSYFSNAISCSEVSE